MNYLTNDTDLTTVAQAIRTKGGTAASLTFPSGFATAIANIPSGGIDPSLLTISGSMYKVFGFEASWAKDLVKSQLANITTSNITDMMNPQGSSANNALDWQSYPNINIADSVVNMDLSFGLMYCTGLLNPPTLSRNVGVSKLQNLFNNCYRLRDISSFTSKLNNFTALHAQTSGTAVGVFTSCYSLRTIPSSFLKELYCSATSTSNSNAKNMFQNCYTLDNIDGFYPMPVTYTSQMFVNTFTNCHRVNSIKFATDNGTPYTRTWSNQAIDLTNYVGFVNASAENKITSYNSGITSTKLVTDAASYEALKNDPDWFSNDLNFSRFNHDGAVDLINSLPDCSAGSNNKIIFYGASGANTDGGAISTLTADEIAVATAKGWTIQMT